MAVIWGLDLHEIQFWKFKGSYMFNQDYHLRRTKMIVYQLAMILCVVSESLGTAALSDYANQQRYVQRTSNSTVVNNEYIGIASFNIFVGVYVATIFGAAFFFDLFWPTRQESAIVRLAWKVCAVLAVLMCLGDAICLTFVVARGSATIVGSDALLAAARLQDAKVNPPLVYRKNARALASAIILWPGWVATVASCYILITGQMHDDRFGPLSRQGATNGVSDGTPNGTGSATPTREPKVTETPKETA